MAAIFGSCACIDFFLVFLPLGLVLLIAGDFGALDDAWAVPYCRGDRGRWW